MSIQNPVQLYQFSKSKPCYYCGTPGPSSKEHAPPQILFAGFTVNSITVPSCDKHNHDKGGSDRAIVTALMRSINNLIGDKKLISPLSENVQKALSIHREQFRQANREVESIPIISDRDAEFVHIKQSIDLREWIRQLTAALLWSAVGSFDPEINWGDARVWSPVYYEFDGPMLAKEAAPMLINARNFDSVLKSHTWYDGWASLRRYPPDIYQFEISFPDAKQLRFKHTFFGQFDWYAGFQTSISTRETVKQVLSSLSRVRS